LAFGSALALFLYPHSVTGILSASSGRAVRRNAALLPGYSLMLGLLALVGFFAIAAGVAGLPEYAAGFKQFGNNFAVPAQYAIYLQLLGGIWIIQTLPAVILGAYTRWFNDWALLVGWVVGIVFGTAMAAAVNLTPTYPLQVAGYTLPGYTALYAVLLNILVTIVLTPVFNAMAAQRTPLDETVASDYYA
jgi:Na+/proline symporter